jgi:hypothetical protein
MTHALINACMSTLVDANRHTIRKPCQTRHTDMVACEARARQCPGAERCACGAPDHCDMPKPSHQPHRGNSRKHTRTNEQRARAALAHLRLLPLPPTPTRRSLPFPSLASDPPLSIHTCSSPCLLRRQTAVPFGLHLSYTHTHTHTQGHLLGLALKQRLPKPVQNAANDTTCSRCEQMRLEPGSTYSQHIGWLKAGCPHSCSTGFGHKTNRAAVHLG